MVPAEFVLLQLVSEIWASIETGDPIIIDA